MSERQESTPSRTPSRRSTNLVEALAVLLVCQLIGEAIVQSLGAYMPGFSFPGPVVGMLILFVWLLARGEVGPGVGSAADGILANLSLLFVPAAVGIVQYGDILMESGFVLILALLLSTALTLVVTVYTFVLVAARLDRGNDDAG